MRFLLVLLLACGRNVKPTDPPAPPPTGAIIELSAGVRHHCLLRDTGEIKCWGEKALHDVPPGSYVQLTSGTAHACALTRAGERKCWGIEAPPAMPGTFAKVAADCALDHRGYIQCPWPRAPVPKIPVKQIDSSNGAGCAIDQTDRLHCWGHYSLEASPSGAFVEVRVSHGSYSACARRADGSVQCWGIVKRAPAGKFARLGPWVPDCGILVDGQLSCRNKMPEGTFTFVASNERGTCAVRSGGELVCFGTTGFRKTPDVELRDLDSDDNGQFCGVTTTGGGLCWGHADNAIPPQSSPFVSVAVGANDTCFLRADGAAVCLASGNRYGPYSAIDIGDHSCGVLRDSKTIECWATTDESVRPPPSGQFHSFDAHLNCGIADATRAITCTDPPPGRFRHIEAANGGWCALREDDTLVCSGAGHLGRYRDLDTFDATTCAIRIDGTLECWGDGDFGTPPRGAFEKVAIDRELGCGLDAGGKLTCWSTLQPAI